MTQISDSLRLLFETSVEADGDRYVVSVPDELVENGSLSEGDVYRVALLASEASTTESATEATPTAQTAATTASESTTDQGSTEGSTSASTGSTDARSTSTQPTNAQSTDSGRQQRGSNDRGKQKPPVEEGEVRKVAIDTLGDQGDGIARVERGFIVIVPGTQPGDDVEVEITDVKDTVAFAEPIGEATVR